MWVRVDPALLAWSTRRIVRVDVQPNVLHPYRLVDGTEQKAEMRRLSQLVQSVAGVILCHNGAMPLKKRH